MISMNRGKRTDGAKGVGVDEGPEAAHGDQGDAGRLLGRVEPAHAPHTVRRSGQHGATANEQNAAPKLVHNVEGGEVAGEHDDLEDEAPQERIRHTSQSKEVGAKTKNEGDAAEGLEDQGQRRDDGAPQVRPLQQGAPAGLGLGFRLTDRLLDLFQQHVILPVDIVALDFSDEAKQRHLALLVLTLGGVPT